MDNYFDDADRMLKIPDPNGDLEFRLDMEQGGADSGATTNNWF